MKVTEEHVTGEIDEILWPTPKEGERLDEFGEEDPYAKVAKIGRCVMVIRGGMKSEPQSKQ